MEILFVQLSSSHEYVCLIIIIIFWNKLKLKDGLGYIYI
jgi:hypothetical protein